MRGKRSKQYRKLLQQYSMAFGFREPYQILVDAQMIQDCQRYSMDLVASLERTLSAKVKPMITQCSIRHLYTLKDVPQSQKDSLINTAKYMERRRCNHHTLDEPLSTLKCLSSVIDPKKSLTNKNRYVVASQEEEVRRYCRGVKGVPLVYVKRSVMVMEPMSGESANVREGIEKSKFRSGLRGRGTGLLGKRKREDDHGSDSDTVESKEMRDIVQGNQNAIKTKKSRGPKGPNPLSIKKPKNGSSGARGGEEEQTKPKNALVDSEGPLISVVDLVEVALDETPNPAAKRKRKRKHKPKQLEDLAAVINGIDETDE